jgi:hypothetical protein
VLLCPFFWLAVLADYHAETVAAGLIPWMLLAYERERLWPFLGIALLVCLGKENLPLVVGGVGFMAIADRRPYAWWVGPGAMGAGICAAAIFWILPAHSGGANLHGSLWAHLGTVDGWTARRSDPSLGPWLLGLGVACCGVPLLRLRTLWPLCPLLLQHGLSALSSARSFDFHYIAPVLPLLVYGTLAGLGRVGPRTRRVLLVGLVIGNAVLLALVGPGQRLLRLQPQSGAARLAAKIPADAPAWASLSTVTRLAAREHVFLVEALAAGRYLGFGGRFDMETVAGATPRYGLIDARDKSVVLPPGLLAVEAVGDLVLLLQEGAPLVTPVKGAKPSFPPGDSLVGLRLRPGPEGSFEVEIAGPYPPMVMLDLVNGSGDVLDRRPHRLLYGLAPKAPGVGRGIWRTRYAPPIFESGRPPGPLQLYLWVPGRPERLLVTTYR